MLRLGLNIGTVAGRRRAVAFEAETVAALAAMSVQPDGTRQGLLNDLIAGLKADGVWAKLDWLSLLAAHDEQAGRLNLVNPAQAMTAVNTPTFETDRGFTGNGTSSYLNSNWNATTASSPKFVQNSAHMGVWVNVNISASGQFDIGTQWRAAIMTRASPNFQFYANSTTAQTVALPVNTSVGHTAWSRTGASAHEVFKDGASVASGTTASTSLMNAPFLVLAVNNAGTPTSFSTRRVAACHWGSGLNATEMAAIRSRLATYMTAIGA